MIFGIVGLGLIGGSLARSIKFHSANTVWGADLDQTTLLQARMVGAIDDELTDEKLAQCDVVLVALYPKAAVRYILERRDRFRAGALVIDCCDLAEGSAITMEKLRKTGGKADRADFLLFNLGWDKRWGTEDYFGDYPCLDDETLDSFDRMFRVRADVNKALELARAEKQVGKPLDAEVTVFADASVLADLEKMTSEKLAEYCIVSKVIIEPGAGAGVPEETPKTPQPVRTAKIHTAIRIIVFGTHIEDK